jgi:hypothetical protein
MLTTAKGLLEWHKADIPVALSLFDPQSNVMSALPDNPQRMIA